MSAYLMIQNPGVAPSQAFTLLGASTKRGSDNTRTIGKFGSGNKHGVAVLLRQGLAPTVFAGNLRMEFDTRPEGVNDGLKSHEFKRVVVKYGGKDAEGKSRSSVEDLGFVLEYGASDWLGVDLALREFVSNSLDRAEEQGEYDFSTKYLEGKGQDFIERAKVNYSAEHAEFAQALKDFRATAKPWENVKIEVVNESQVRAKAGFTRVFVPMNEEVFRFFDNLGKWFLHFSEPELLGQTILPKANRNIGDRKSAVIFRRGVRVREFESANTPSLFDYNLEQLQLDESRKVDDWHVQHYASTAIATASVETLQRLWQSFMDGGLYWEHSFAAYGLESSVHKLEVRERWGKAFEAVAGEQAVISVKDGGERAARKGYKVIVAPEPFVTAAEKYGVRTPSKVLSADERDGRELFDSTPDAEAAVDFAWDLVTRYGVANGRQRPVVKTFRKIMDAGSQDLGFYRDGVVYINQDIATHGSLSLGWHGLTQQLLVTALEEVAHHVTGATDNSRDFQDFMLNMIVYMAKERAGVV